MSEQSLRDALEALAADYATIDAEQITDLLAAHPAEPAPACLGDGVCTNPRCPRHGVGGSPSDGAVEAAWEALSDGDIAPEEKTRAALEAAYSVDAPRLLLDRGAVRLAIADELDGEGVVSYGLAPKLTDRVMDVARPMPTEVEVADLVLRIFMDGGAARTHAQEAASEIAHAVLALLNGSTASATLG